MTDLFLKIIALVFIAVVAYNVIIKVKPEFGLFIVVACGIIVIVLLSDGIVASINVFKVITDKSGIDTSAFTSIIKIIGIGYLTEYSSALCDDNGCTSLGKKIQFAGKITIFIMALPIVNGVMEMIGGLM